ncbi:MAG: Fe-S cluster assembly protein SufD [Notoacmeibacter sp.]|nr:Fe-S cluster assembly protein SufD [Notoacmeibacter sp.]
MNVHSKIQLTEAETELIRAFVERSARLPGNAQTVMTRDSAIEAIKAAGLPTRKVEAWHYTDLRRLLSAVPAYDPEVPVDDAEPLIAGSPVAAVANGMTARAPNVDGVSFSTFFARLSEEDSIAVPERGDDTVGLINIAFVSGGWGVEIADGVELAAPLELQNLHGGGQVHVRFPVTVGNQAKATIIERQTGQGEALVSSISDVEIGEGAELTWIIVQEQPDDTTHLGQFAARLAKDAKLTLFIMNAGGKLVRQEVRVAVVGEGGDFQMRCINLLAGDNHTDVTMVLDHAAPDAGSVEIVRNVVTGRAEGAFQGQIRVAQAAQKTDARMACNTLLLSDEGGFSTKPELEIFADDVACGHGATVTEIDSDHLFYLMSRGIGEHEARRLLVKAFLAEVIEDLDDEALVEVLEAKLDAWFAEHG